MYISLIVIYLLSLILTIALYIYSDFYDDASAELKTILIALPVFNTLSFLFFVLLYSIETKQLKEEEKLAQKRNLENGIYKVIIDGKVYNVTDKDLFLKNPIN